MKKTATGLMATLLALFLLVASLPLTAAAASPKNSIDYTLVLEAGFGYKNSTITGTRLTSEELAALGITADGTHYTFENVDLFSTAKGVIQIYDSAAAVTLIGDNTLTNAETADHCMVLTALGSLTLVGDHFSNSSLTVTAGGSTGGASYGVSCNNSLVIKNCTLSATANQNAITVACSAIITKFLTVNNSKISAYCGPVGSTCVGIIIKDDGSASIVNSTVTADAATRAWLLGANVAKPVLANATVRARSGNAWATVTSPTAATFTDHTAVEISLKTSTATPADIHVGGVQMKTSTYYRYYLPSSPDGSAKSLQTTPPTEGGYAYLEDGTTLVLHDYEYEGKGTIQATGTAADIAALYAGISSPLKIKLQGENRLVNTTTSADTDPLAYSACNIYGLFVIGELDISGGSLEVYGEQCGISSAYSLLITDATITGSTDANADGIGLYTTQDVAAENSVLTLSGGAAALLCYSSTITDSTVTCPKGCLIIQNTLSVTGSTLSATDPDNSTGLSCPTLAAENSLLTVVGSDCAIDASTLTLNGGELTATSATAALVCKPDISGFSCAQVLAGASEADAQAVTDLDSDYELELFVKIHEKPPTPINLIEMNDIVEPVIGEKFSFDFSFPTGAAYADTGALYAWAVSDTPLTSYESFAALPPENLVSPFMPDPPELSFEEGKCYTCVGLVELDEPDYFPEDTLATINGHSATVYLVSDDNCIFWYSFGPLEPPHTHDFGEEWASDKDNHWHECACGDTQDLAPHEPDRDAATETDPVLCAVCGYEIAPALGHTHDFGEKWASDKDNHWHECACGDTQDLASHEPNRDAATETDPILCAVCGYEIAPALGHTHDFGEEWASDKDNHWHECACGDTQDLAPHEPNRDAATETDPVLCAVCGYEIAPALGVVDPPVVQKGDVNGDGNINMKDVLALRKHLADLAVELDLVAADTNSDESVNMKDVLALRKFVAGLITSFDA